MGTGGVVLVALLVGVLVALGVLTLVPAVRRWRRRRPIRRELTRLRKGRAVARFRLQGEAREQLDRRTAALAREALVWAFDQSSLDREEFRRRAAALADDIVWEALVSQSGSEGDR